MDYEELFNKIKFGKQYLVSNPKFEIKFGYVCVETEDDYLILRRDIHYVLRYETIASFVHSDVAKKKVVKYLVEICGVSL